MAVAGLVPLMVPRVPGKAFGAAYTFFVVPVITFFLLASGAGGPAADGVDALGLALGLIGLVALARRGGARRGLRRCCGCSTASGSSSPIRWWCAGCSRPAASRLAAGDRR
jgi:hypothetical protein